MWRRITHSSLNMKDLLTTHIPHYNQISPSSVDQYRNPQKLFYTYHRNVDQSQTLFTFSPRWKQGHLCSLPDFCSWVRVTRPLVFYVMFSRSLVFFSIFFWPYFYPSFFDLRLLIIPLVSSNLFTYIYIYHMLFILIKFSKTENIWI